MKVSLKRISLILAYISIIVGTVFGTVKIGGFGRYTVIIRILSNACGTIYIFRLKKLQSSDFLKYLLLFGAIISFSCLYSPTDYTLVREYIIRFWRSFYLVVIVSYLIDNEHDLNELSICCILVGVIYSLFVYNHYGFQELLTSRYRMDNMLGNQNEIGMYCAMSIILSFASVLKDERIFAKIIFTACILCCLPLVFLSGSRKAILTLIIGILVLVLSFSKGTMRSKLGAIALVILLVAVLYKLSSSFAYLERLTARFNELFETDNFNRSDSTRMRMINEGFDYFLESPLWGKGFISSYSFFGLYAHNNAIEIMMDSGLIAFVLYYINHIKIVHQAIKKWKMNKMNCALVFALISAVLFTDIGVITFYNRFVLIILLICVKTLSFCEDGYNDFV